MRRILQQAATARRVGAWLALSAAAWLSGCASENPFSGDGTIRVFSSEPARQAVSLAEFVTPASAPVPAPVAPVEAAPSTPPALYSDSGEVAPDEPLADGAIPASDSPPDPLQFAPQPEDTPGLIARQPQLLARSGDSVIVEGLIGQINGRPIFADEFFAPIEARILAERANQSPGDFARFLDWIVTGFLTKIVDNELFIAEAESQLTPEQQQGVFAWLRNMQEQTIAERGGVRSQAERDILESEGVTLGQHLRSTKHAALIQTLLQKRIAPRVIVSWRDVEREYERRHAEFNTPGRITLARISLNTERDAERIANVARCLEAGQPFAQVAEAEGLADGGMWNTFDLGPGGVADLQIADAIKGSLAGLGEGQTAGPVQVGSSTWWVHVVKIEAPQGRSLYDIDVQRILRDSLRRRRELIEIDRYTASLRERWVADDLEKMRQRLLVIARNRYLR